MISPDVKSQYTATIGIECHVQFKTKSKLFSGAGNDARQADPNTLVNHIDFGLPGALPVLNAEAVHLAIKAAFALGTEPQKFSKFDRKHYFYPDLPMGYQITQYDEPIILGGSVKVILDDQEKVIHITRAHLEADAGKSTHPAGKDYSLVDLNRAGTPLLEIVSEPEMHSGAEAKAYARELYLRMKFADVSEADLYYGNMRFDVNVSVSKSNELGTRSETKNLNSFRAVEKAVDYEINRQIELLEKGEQVVQETRGWDDAKQKTLSQRSKENADDYRYFPDPDIPPVIIDDEQIAKVKAEMPILPAEWRSRLKDLGINSASVETLLERNGEHGLDYLARIDECLQISPELGTFVAKFIVNNLKLDTQNDETATTAYLATTTQFNDVYELFAGGKISSNSAVTLLTSATDESSDLTKVAESQNLLQVSDEGALSDIVVQVLADNPQAAEDVKNGEMKAIGFLVGQVMKASKGQANPQLAQQLIRQQLGS